MHVLRTKWKDSEKGYGVSCSCGWSPMAFLGSSVAAVDFGMAQHGAAMEAERIRAEKERERVQARFDEIRAKFVRDNRV